jgi:hypothetical protein
MLTKKIIIEYVSALAEKRQLAHALWHPRREMCSMKIESSACPGMLTKQNYE